MDMWKIWIALLSSLVWQSRSFVVPLSEFTALQDLFESTLGYQWSWLPSLPNGLHWNFSAPNFPCFENWQGITCTCGNVSNNHPFDGHYGANYYYFYDTIATPNDANASCNVQKLNLVRRNLIGSIPTSIGNFNRLTHLHLDGNLLAENIPEEIGNLGQLQLLSLTSNLLVGPLPQTMGSLQNLSVLNIAINSLSQEIPSALTKLNQLTQIYLASNYLSGTLPEDMSLWSELTYISLHSNQFHGTIPVSLGKLTSLAVVDCSANHFQGNLPFASSNDLLNVSALLLYDNLFSGLLPESYVKFQQLTNLDLHNNAISGDIPHLSGMWRNLSFIDLSLNRMSGSLRNSVASLVTLEVLFLSDNFLTGDLGDIFKTNQTSLRNIDLSNNQITGSIPSAIFELPNLLTLALVQNCITGSLSPSMCHARHMTALSLDGLQTASTCQNRFFRDLDVKTSYTLNSVISGSIPTCLFSLPHIQTLHLSGNGIADSLPDDLVISSSLEDLALSHNALTGNIPISIQLNVWQSNLDLSYNKFNGVLNAHMAEIPNNATLTLAVNRLSGTIPSQLYDAQHINILNGNLFTCSFTQESLPLNDPKRTEYDCGSNSFDVSFIAWSILVFAYLCAWVFVARIIWKEKSLKSDLPVNDPQLPVRLSIRAFQNISAKNNQLLRDFRSLIISQLQYFLIFYGSSEDKNQRMSRYFNQLVALFPAVMNEQELLCHRIGQEKYIMIMIGEIFDNLRMITALVATVSIALFMPTYLILSVFYNSASNEYAYNFSSSFLSGVVPAVTVLILDVLLIMLLYRVFRISYDMTNAALIRGSSFRSSCSSSVAGTGTGENSLKAAILGDNHCDNNCENDDGQDLSPTSQRVTSWFDSELAASRHQLDSETTSPIISAHHLHHQQQQQQQRESSAFTSLSPSHSLPMTQTQSRLPLSNTLENETHDVQHVRHKSHSQCDACGPSQGAASTSRVDSSATSIASTTGSYAWLRNCLFMATIALINGIVVIACNIGYITITIYCSEIVLTISQIALAGFKLCWTSLLIPRLVKLGKRLVVHDSTTLPDISRRHRNQGDILFQLVLVLFNNLVIPCIATALVQPNCFYHVWQPLPDVYSTYYYNNCRNQDEFGHCIRMQQQSFQTVYTPPFLYSYQCSSNLISSYCAVFMYMFAFVAFFKPFAMTALYYFMTPTEDLEDVQNIANDASKCIFYQDEFVIDVISNLAMLITFGVIFPPLAVVVCIAIVSQTLFSQLCIGKIFVISLMAQAGDSTGTSSHRDSPPLSLPLSARPSGVSKPQAADHSNASQPSPHNSRTLSSASALTSSSSSCVTVNTKLTQPSTSSNAVSSSSSSPSAHVLLKQCQLKFENDCKGLPEALNAALWLIVPFCSFFYAVFIFDVLGDAVGALHAMWAPIVLALSPLAISAAMRCGKHRRPHLGAHDGRLGPLGLIKFDRSEY